MGKNNLPVIDKFIKNNVKENVLREYSNNTVIRGLIQLIPYGGLIDTVVTTAHNNILLDRAKTFYSELNTGKIILTSELIKNEDFLHTYFSTYKAALYSRQRSKIRFFARLLRNGVFNQYVKSANEYEDYLKILEELSYREIIILTILYKFEQETPKIDNENQVELASKFWNSFLREVKADLKIDGKELPGLINRLGRTGCYNEFTGGFLGYTGGLGQTTGLFHKLMELIEIKKDDLLEIKNFEGF